LSLGRDHLPARPTPDEPDRTDSLQLLRQYADQAVDARAAMDEPAASAP